MPCTKYKKLPLELQHFLVIHHDKSGPDIYKYLLFPPANRQERERLRLGLRYYKEAKVTNPEGFQRLLEDAVNFFAATPPTSLEYLCLKQLAITPPKTPHKTTSPFRLGGRRESLAFIQPDDDSSFEGSVHSSPVVTPAAKRVKANPINADKKMPASSNSASGITTTVFTRQERHPQGKMEVDYIGVKYRPKSLIDVFTNAIKHTVARDGMSFDIEIPKFDGDTKQNVDAVAKDDDGDAHPNPLLDKMDERIGTEYVNALLMQITTAKDEGSEFEVIAIPFKRKVIPESLVVHKLPATMTAETGKYDSQNNPKTYSYKVVDYVYVFKIPNSERFIKRYAANSNGDDLADAFDDLLVG